MMAVDAAAANPNPSSSSSSPGPPTAPGTYVVTAQPPTVVTHSLTARFTSADEVNLIVVRCTRLEVHTLNEAGLEPVLDVGLYGRVASVRAYRPAGEPADLLFVVTERFQFCVLAYADGRLVTRARGDASSKAARRAERQTGLVDPQCRLLGLHLYDGLFQAVPLDAGGRLYHEAVPMRLPELHVLAVCFLDGAPAAPVLAVLHEDPHGQRHLKTYGVDLDAKELVEGPWGPAACEAGAASLVPVPGGGVLVVGELSVAYHLGGGGHRCSAALPSTVVTACGALDASRFLLGDSGGRLYVAVLRRDGGGGGVVGVQVEELGFTSAASTISYLDSSFVFVGSAHGDSQLVRLRPEPDEDGSHVEEVDAYENLGPVVDMCVVDLDRHGQGQLVTCSGAYQDGSVRVVRNGVAINEAADVDMPGIKGLWSLRGPDGSPHEKYLVQSFVAETRVLCMTGEALDEIRVPGFDAASPTLFCGSAAGGRLLVQVTPAAVLLADAATLEPAGRWDAPAGARISVAHANDAHALVAVNGRGLRLLDLSGGGPALVASAELDREVACVDVSPVHGGAPLAAVGMWGDLTVRVLSLPALAEVSRRRLEGETLPRSVLLAELGGVAYLFAGLGDGFLQHYEVSAAGQLEGQGKRVALGTQPVNLAVFRSSGGGGGGGGGGRENDAMDTDGAAGEAVAHVFASCDRPTIVYSSRRGNGKLLFSNVNERDVSFMAQFNTADFPDCLALATEERLVIGDIDDEIQRLHTRTVPLGEQPRRVAHQRCSGTVAVATSRLVTDPETAAEDGIAGGPAAAEAGEVDFVRLLDDSTFDVLDSYQLRPYESGCSLVSVPLGRREDGDADGDADADAEEFYVLGTAMALPDEDEPSTGRLLVFRAADGKLALVSETEVRGAAYTLAPFSGGSLLAGVNSKVQLFRWTAGFAAAAAAAPPPSGKAEVEDGAAAPPSYACQLVEECSHRGHIVALYVKTDGDFVLVGDMMRSVMVLRYDEASRTLVESARDFNSNWMTAVGVLGPNEYVGAENAFNLFTVRRHADATTDEARARLLVTGRWHLGDFVNAIRPGSVVMAGAHDRGYGGARPTHLVGTINGSVLVLASLDAAAFAFLARLEAALEGVVHGVGGLGHREWRSFVSDTRTEPPSGYIDGDLIEQLLELEDDLQARVARDVGVDLDELLKRVEDLSRLH